jgi:hypothetical protein
MLKRTAARNAFARIALTSLVIKDNAAINSLSARGSAPEIANLRRAGPAMHSRAARILLASTKFHSLTWILHGTNELTPHFFQSANWRMKNEEVVICCRNDCGYRDARVCG